MFLLCAYLKAKPAHASEVESILRGLVSIAAAEVGNIVYAVHREQGNTENFVLYELYESSDACDRHMADQCVQRALKQFESLLESAPRVMFCDTVSTTLMARGIDRKTSPAPSLQSLA